MTASCGAEGVAKHFTCLLVDDDASFSGVAAQVIRDEGGEPTCVSSLAAAEQAVAEKFFDTVLLDNHLPDGKGYGFYNQLARRYPEAPIVMVTGMPDLAEAVSLTRNGLFEYLTKPIGVEGLSACLRNVKIRLATQPGLTEIDGFFGDSPSIRKVITELQQAARHPTSTVLLTGETGVGKDVAARILHRFTNDEKAPYVAVNCGAVPVDIFEAELFGAERGAYTGADKARPGLVSAAGKGTLFLDEIGEVPLLMQSKLLRLVEAREFRSLGSTQTQSFEGRFVAASNRDLPSEVKAGRFREDLLYRLDVFSIEIPPLRQRRADLPQLAELLLGQLSKKYKRSKPLIRTEDLEALRTHTFPGNVRELRNVLERSLLKTRFDANWLTMDLGWMQAAGNKSAPGASQVKVPSPGGRDLPPLEAQEYCLIRDTLRETNGGIRRAASKLGMSPQALLRRLEKWPELRVTAN